MDPRGRWEDGQEPLDVTLFLYCLFSPQDKDLKQYLDDCGNVINMHNVKVGVGQEAGAGGEPHSPTPPRPINLPEMAISHLMFFFAGNA